MNESELIQKKNKKSRWPLFLTGLALSLFVGGAIRTQLNSEKLVSQINQSIYQIHSKFQVKLGEVNVNLSKGLIPVFEIAIKDMNLLNSAGCSGIDELDIKDIRLNVGFFSSLWNKKLIIEGIQIGDLKIDRSQGLCVSEQGKENSQEVAAESLEGPNSSKNHEIPFSKEEVSKDAKVFKAAVQNFFRSDLHQLLLYIHSIEIQRLVLNNKTPEFEVKAIEIDILSNSSHNTSIKVTGELNYPQYKIYFSKASLLKVDISKDHISFQLDTQYKEGLIQTRGVFDLELSSYKMKSYLKNFPLWKISEIFGTLQTNLFTQLKTKNLWIDCSLEASWLVESNQSKAEVQKCFLHGPDGKIFISGAASDLMGKVRLDGVKLTIEQFSLKSLLTSFDSKGPSGILSQYGFLDGELSIDSLEKMSWKWSLSDVEMHFLNRGRRGFEKLNFISGQMNLADHRFSGLIEKIDFDKGEFKGEISFNVDETFRSGLAQFNVSRLIFSEGIQGLLFGGSSSTAEVYGQAKIEDGLVKKWRGSIGFSEIDGVNWNIEKLKLNVNYDDKLLDMRVKLKKLNFLKNHEVAVWMNPLVYQFSKDLSDVEFSNVSGSIKVKDKAGQWDKFVFHKDKVLLTTQGEWSQQGIVKGKVLTKDKGTKLNWGVDGSVDNLSIHLIPKSEFFKGQLKKKITLTQWANLENGFQNILPFFSNSTVSTPIENLESIRNKVIIEAKKIMPKRNDGDNPDE